MFNSEFTNISSHQIVNEIKTKGYFAFEGALTEQCVEEFLQEIDFNQVLVNTNDIGVVIAQNQRFLTHCLANSKKSYDIITSRLVLDICKGYFDDTYNLTNHRIYTTPKISRMPWHTDNNLQIGKKLVSKHNMPGLLFLFYLSDVTQNSFQYINDSHNWSDRHHHEIYLDSEYIQEKYQKDIVNFPMKKGSFIVCNTHGVHRAEPFQDDKYTRKTLLFQVDQIGSENSGHGEKNIVNTEFIDNPTQELMDYLGFGFKRDYPPFPNSSVLTMMPKDILALQKELLPKTIQALVKNLFIQYLSGDMITNIKRMLWSPKSK
ncbi:MAG: phytanoyl-CoA dioxygenase family protein [Mastigocoleus sp.]